MKNVDINKNARLSQHFTLGKLCKTSVKTADGNIPSHATTGYTSPYVLRVIGVRLCFCECR